MKVCINNNNESNRVSHLEYRRHSCFESRLVRCPVSVSEWHGTSTVRMGDCGHHMSPPQWVLYTLHHLDHRHFLSYPSWVCGGRWYPRGFVQPLMADSRNTEQMGMAWVRTKHFRFQGYQDDPVGAYQVNTFRILRAGIFSQREWRPPLPPFCGGWGYWQPLGMVLVALSAGECYWLLVGRNQGHHYKFYSRQDNGLLLLQ